MVLGAKKILGAGRKTAIFAFYGLFVMQPGVVIGA